MAPLDVLPVLKAKEHLQIKGDLSNQPGGEPEFIDMIGAAVERVQRHLGGREPSSTSYIEVLACKMVLADYWETQGPKVTARAGFGGAQSAQDDGLDAPVSLGARLTALLGDPVDAPGEGPAGSFPTPEPWPDPISIGGWRW